MKRIFIALVVFLKMGSLAAQPGLTVKAGASVKATNGAFIVVNNASLVNDGSIQQTANTSTFKFTGTNVDTIKGSGSFVFDKMQLAKTTGSWIVLNSNVKVLSQLNFSSGLLDLDNYVVDLGSTGMINGESETSRAMSDGLGYIQSTSVLNAPNAGNPGNLGAIITSDANLGSTIVRRGHASQSGINGSANSIKRYYDIVPSNNSALNSTLRFNYFNAELNGIAEPTLIVWRKSGTSWSSLSSTSQDTSMNYVEKKSIQNFDRMILAAGCPTINVAIPDVYAVVPGSAANTLYIGYGPTSLTLVAQKEGGTAPFSYKWTVGSPGGTNIGVDSFLTVNPTAKGTYTYYVTINDAYGCKSSVISKTIIVRDVRCGKKLDMVTICQKQTNGTFQTNCIAASKVASELANGSVLDSCQKIAAPITQRTVTTEIELHATVYPNPSTAYFTLAIKSGNQQPVLVTITDALGRVVERIEKQRINGNLFLGHRYRPGAYFIEVKQGKENRVIKVLKLAE